MELFSNFTCIGTALNYDDGLNLILKFQPDFVFLEVNPQVKSSYLSLLLINELHRYLKQVPKIIAISSDTTFAFDALKYDVADFLIKPLSEFDLRKTFLRIEKNQVNENAPVENLPINFSETIKEIKEVTNDIPYRENSLVRSNYPNAENSSVNESILSLKEDLSNLNETIKKFAASNNPAIDYDQLTSLIIDAITRNFPVQKDIDFSPLLNKMNEFVSGEKIVIQEQEENERNLICIKSYGDYRFLELDDLAFLQADNNSTDITLKTGEQITAFKTLKYFEENLPSNFYRIHNSYIVNKNYISRIHTGNSLCYIKNSKNQIPFSKSYKENIDLILAQLAGSEFKDS